MTFLIILELTQIHRRHRNVDGRATITPQIFSLSEAGVLDNEATRDYHSP
jgi:hypothetical protein